MPTKETEATSWRPLQRVQASDYLLVSGDGQRVLRFARYPVLWAAFEWTGDPKYVDTAEGAASRWKQLADNCDTRTDAIKAALR